MGERRLGRVLSLFLCARMVLGAIFVYAAFDKIFHPGAFAEAIYNYQILPGVLINSTAVILPWVELFLGFLLITGIWLPGATILTMLLMSAFFGAILFNVARGLDVHCGCFSTARTASQGVPMAWYVVRDGAFLLLAFYLSFYTFLRHRRIISEGEGPF